MILTKLKEYAENRMDLPPKMYVKQNITWYIDLTPQGKFEGFICLKTKENKKKGIEMEIPYIPKSGKVIRPQLLADKVEYSLGVAKDISDISETEKALKYHDAFKALIKRCFDQTQEPILKSITSFLDSSELEQVKNKLAEEKDFKPSDRLTFRVDGKIPANAAENWQKIEDFWAKDTSIVLKKKKNENKPEMTCLITGNVTEVEQRMPIKIKGIIGGQSSGTALVSANNNAFESYGFKNSLTSPISTDAAEKFAKALNSLIANEQGQSRIYLGSTVYLFWTREKTGFNPLSFLDKPDPGAVANLLKSPLTSKQSSSLKANQFYGLSLTANNARAVVRDWLETTVPNVESNLKTWFQRQQIIDVQGAEYRPLPIYVLAASIYRDAAKEMQPSVPTALMRNALKGDRLPYELLNKLVRRNWVERNVSYPRAMLTKLIFSSDLSTQTMMTDMEQLNLNPDLEGGDRSAYYCGRLLAVLEAIQRKAIGSVNASLTDRYYGAASSTPANAFSSLKQELG